jgi:peptidoglycan hydrolase-like protein with peptidoglycan-binding domain
MNSYSFDNGVAAIQSGLDKIGYEFGRFGIDGKFGNETEKNVTKFQEDENLEVTGKMTTSDLEKLKSMISKKTENKDFEKEDKKDDLKSSDQIILVGGLDYRSGDLKISQQVSKIQNKVPNKKVFGFRYKDYEGAIKKIKENPNSYVVLFSAGCSYSSEIAKEVKDKTKLFIVEPYASSLRVVNTVNNAVSLGVPSSNVIVGPIKPRGLGVVSGATKTPNNYDHWGALDFVSKFLK